MQGCTHLTELLGPMATALIQSTYVGHMKALRRQLEENPDFVMSKPWLIGTCHAYDAAGEAARWIWPVKNRKAD